MSKPPLLPLLVVDVSDAWITVLSQEGIPFVRRAESNADSGRFVLFDSRRTRKSKLNLLPRQTAIDLATLGVDTSHDSDQSSRRISLSLDPRERTVESSTAVLDRHAAWRRFPVGQGVFVTERVSRYDHSAHRERMVVSLRTAIEQAGGIWLTVAPYPFPYRSMFNFRIDHDRYVADDFGAMMDMLERLDAQRCTTHYVSGAAFANHRRPLRRLRQWDVGSHGFRHHTYRTLRENYRNIERGIETLERAGIHPRGFVSPGGVYNTALARAMDMLEVGHSGDFSLAYDDLPFVPTGRQTLQIPIHPICLGLFRDGFDRFDISRVIDYFNRTIDRYYAAGRPLMFYGHPTGRLGVYPELIQAIFTRVAQLGVVWRATQSQLADWWESRAAIRISVKREDGILIVRADGLPHRPQAGLEIRKGKLVARVPLERHGIRINPAELGWEPDPRYQSAESSFAEPASIRVAPPGGLRGRIKRLIDWEYETPLEEIQADSLMNLIKRTLRRMKAKASVATSGAEPKSPTTLRSESETENEKQDRRAA